MGELGARRGLLADLADRERQEEAGGLGYASTVQWGGSHGATGIDMDEQVGGAGGRAVGGSTAGVRGAGRGGGGGSHRARRPRSSRAPA